MPGERRDLFQNTFSYLLACIGFAVGLGNVWRFPKVCLENGGGAFLIPYFVVFLIEGVPLMILELTIGQRYRGSPVHCYGRISKYLWGIGVAMAFASFFTSLYYNTIMGYAFVYLFNSFQSELPWLKCPIDVPDCGNPSEYYFNHQVVEKSSGLEDTSGGENGFVWHLYLATIVAWGAVFAALITGVKSLGRVVYFTALYPYIILTILIILGVQEDGWDKGLRYLFKADFTKVYDPNVWLAASEQIFFSSGVGFGGLIALSSHMPVRNSAFRDAFVILCINSFTSLYACIGTFSIKGHMAELDFQACMDSGALNCKFDDFMEENDSGYGLVFVAMAQALDTLAGSGAASVLSVMFYFMLVTLGLDSQFGFIECYVSILYDFTALKRIPRVAILAVVCIASAAFSLLFCTTRGIYIIDIFDLYGAVFVLVIVGFFEFVAISWVHGIHAFSRDFHIINDFHPWPIMKLFWAYISPAALLASVVGMFVTSLIDETLLVYGDDQTYPTWATVLALLLIFVALIWIPLAAVFGFCFSWSFGDVDYNEKDIIADLEPKEYYLFERICCCIIDDFDFPENIQMQFIAANPSVKYVTNDPTPQYANNSPGQYRKNGNQ